MSVIDLKERHYVGKINRWVDGDTVDIEVDAGFKIYTKQRFRLLNINTPERGKPGFYEATAHADKLAPEGAMVHLTCTGTDKYGRWIAIITTADGVNVNDAQVAGGFADFHVY